MAIRCPRILIAYELEDLDEGDLERFRAQMRAPRGDGLNPERFRRSQVNGRTCQQLADTLVDAFAHNAVPVTVGLFRALDLAHPANNLEKKAKDLPKEKNAEAPPAPKEQNAEAPPAPKERHFVDRHRITLVNRVCNLNPILDDLLDKGVLQSEQYDQAMEISTTQNQMRFLFNGPLKAGGDRSKDVLLSALEKEEHYLMEELRETEG